MKFVRYNSIENSYRGKFLDYLANYGLTEGDWVVQEKIHGANFSIWYDGTDIIPARRKGFLSESDNFYGKSYKPILERLTPKIIELYDICNGSVIVLYGELFGGIYPHPEIKKDPIASKIQDSLFYSPYNEFYVFDIKVDDRFLSVNIVEQYCEKYSFFYAKTLFRGPLEGCLEYPNKFQSKIPEWLGLPSIEDNICEGIVIKPVEVKFLPSGTRAILKNKNEKYADFKLRTPKKVIPLSLEAEELYKEFGSLITMARLDSVMSKEGDLTNKDFGKVLNWIWQDILEEFFKDNKEEFKALIPEERQRITKTVRSDIVECVRIEFFSRV